MNNMKTKKYFKLDRISTQRCESNWE